MDRLTLFGLFAVLAMLISYALENRGSGSYSSLQVPAYWVRLTDSFKARGLSEWWKQCGRS